MKPTLSANYHFCISIILFLLIFFYPGLHLYGQTIPKGKTYYFNSKGSNNNNGSKLYPWKSFNKLKDLSLSAGDTIFLNGTDTFAGPLKLKQFTRGNAEKPVVITSYGNGKSTVDGQYKIAINLSRSAYINIKNIICIGAGRKGGNKTNGISIDSSAFVNIENIEVSGFQKSGLRLYCCVNVKANNVYAHDNGFAGIYMIGKLIKQSCRNIVITNCKAENNPGDPTVLDNHSGNGILAGFCKNVLIDYCTASNNGWDMPRLGNGPVGIWCYEADSVIIQHCISYNNKTSKGGGDGGGYDFDGGVTNSVIQYCLSYGNQGSAFGIFQYAGASPWHNNTIRFCISENDGNVSAAHANTYIWNSSRDSSRFKNLLFYNNTIYNSIGAAIKYATDSDHSNFRFYNNIFIAANDLVTGKEKGDVFLANDWWSFQKGFNIGGNYNFHDWARRNNKEQLNNEVKGLNVIPQFMNAGKTAWTDANNLTTFEDYVIADTSLVMQAGLDLKRLFGVNTGNINFNGKPLQKTHMGACDHYKVCNVRSIFL